MGLAIVAAGTWAVIHARGAVPDMPGAPVTETAPLAIAATSRDDTAEAHPPQTDPDASVTAPQPDEHLARKPDATQGTAGSTRAGMQGPAAITAAPGSTLAAGTPGTAPAPEKKRDVAWTDGVAITWVNVRADRSRDAEIVGVITPDSRVQIGELRAGWFRVRSSNGNGWADRRLIAVDSSEYPR